MIWQNAERIQCRTVDVSCHDKVIDDDFGHAFACAPRNAILGADGDVKNAALSRMSLRHKGLMVGLFRPKEDGRTRVMLI